MSKQNDPIGEKPPSITDLLHHLPIGKLEIITGVSDSGEVYHQSLPRLGHTLLAGGSNGKTNTALGWVLQLSTKNTPKQIQIAIIDRTAKQDLAKKLAPAPRRHLAHVASTEHEIAHVLDVLQKALSARLKQRGIPDAWLIIIEGLTELQADPNTWTVVQSFLQEGKAAHMFVLATTRQFLPSGALHDAFDTHIMFAPASEDTSVDALSIRVAGLHVPDAQPIVFLRIWFLSSLPGACERCGEAEGKFLLERYVTDEQAKDDETFTRQWYQAILEQMTVGLQIHSRTAVCEACVSHVLDTFVQLPGTGHAMLAQSALFPKDQLSQLSLVGFMQVGKPGVALACVCADSLEKLREEIREKGMIDPQICPHCGAPLKEPCSMCQQVKCWSCEGETPRLLRICAACLNQYQASVVTHFLDKDAAKKHWCDTCQDWMTDPHRHKSPRIWRS